MSSYELKLANMSLETLSGCKNETVRKLLIDTVKVQRKYLSFAGKLRFIS